MIEVRKIIIYSASAVCAVLAAVACYGFGLRISGQGLGFLLAVNGAMLAALLAGMLLERLLPASDRRAPTDQV